MSGLIVLRAGVDTAEVSFKGPGDPNLLEHIDELKRKAQETECPQPIGVGDWPLVVSPTGVKPWPYLLATDHLHLRLGRSEYTPTVSAKLLSLGLLAYGHEPLMRLATEYAEVMGAPLCMGLSRLDLAIDFQGCSFTQQDFDSIVCRAPFRPIYPSNANPQSAQFGKGKMLNRLYNKTQEIKSKGGTHWLKVWEQCNGYDPAQDVWRFETQVKSKVLNELGVRDPDVAFGNLPRILGYALSWSELRIPSGHSSEQREIDPRWLALAACKFVGEPLERIKESAQLAAYDRLLPQIAGTIRSAAAATETYTLDRMLAKLAIDLKRYYADKGAFADLVESRRQQRLIGKRM